MDFDTIAENWDTSRRIERAKIIAGKIRESIDIRDDYSALDFGCGTGLISFNLCNEFRNIDLVDNSSGMISRLREKIALAKISNMNPVHLDLTENLELNNRYDVIYSSMVLHHIEDISSLIHTFKYHLKENGTLCIVDLETVSQSFHIEEPGFKGHHGFDIGEFEHMLEKSEFTDIRADRFYHSEKRVENEMVPYSLFIITAKKG